MLICLLPNTGFSGEVGHAIDGFTYHFLSNGNLVVTELNKFSGKWKLCPHSYHHGSGSIFMCFD